MSDNRYMFLGDCHGDTQAVLKAIRRASKAGVSTIIQVGDFGFWEHTKEGERYLDVVSRELQSHDIMMDFLDGNHENHDLLRQRYGMSGHVRPHLRWMKRGDIRFLGGEHSDVLWSMFMGGAGSIDSSIRLEADPPGSSWWSSEIITDADVERALKVLESWELAGATRPKILFCHDMPTTSPLAKDPNYTVNYAPAWVNDRLLASRQNLMRVVGALRPKLIVHGHMHVEYFSPAYPGYQPHNILGLGMNFRSDRMWCIVDVDGHDCVRITHQFRGLQPGRNLLEIKEQ